MKRKDFMKIGDVIPDYIKVMGIAGALVGNQVSAAFDEAVGTSVKKYVTSREFKGGKLYVVMNSSVARDAASKMKMQIIESVNERIGNQVLKEIIFR
ncbi:MAG: hypothetical protein CVT93_05740 [Bacteroidetes bacterium HGW-Bacteroidetes-10]|jgi:hypothetical protein|nr:MAG: hypothetical protein CVT93_05740 [Bacteroidetes bacterium HGW-Bacteroidetes-10]